MSTREYRLEGHKAVPGKTDWAQTNRIVAKTSIGKVRVSTVFLGIDHNHSDDGPPQLFETMIFDGEHDGLCSRCSTWEEAEAMHKVAVELVENKGHPFDPDEPAPLWAKEKLITIGELFTLEETKLAARIFNEYNNKKSGLNKAIVAQVVEPALSRINTRTGQENDARYLAYALEYTVTQAANSPHPKADQQ